MSVETQTMAFTVLLVDDDEAVRTSIQSFLDDQGYRTHTARDTAEGLQKLQQYMPDVLLVDLRMPGRDGFYLIEEARKFNSATAVIVISGHADVEKAVRATKMGAFQFIEKPFSIDDVARVVQEATGPNTTLHHLRRVNEDGIRVETEEWSLVGISDAIKRIYRQTQMVSQSDYSTVLIQGASGTGKEVVARAIFEFSNHRSDGRFVDVNCAALSETLLEAELFGHEKGAFTGATQAREGLFEAAHRGAIFLDEVGEMPLKLQAKLLRVLEEKSFKRVGSTQNVRTDCRVIASTNRDLWEMVEEGDFRRDLFYRLDVFAIRVPPLAERPEDIPVLSSYFLDQLSDACNKQFTGFAPDALEQLQHYHWPGNVRELRNVIERAIILGSGRTIKTDDLIISSPMRTQQSSPCMQPRVESLESMEKRMIQKVLQETGWHKTKSADILGINRTTLWQKIKRYELEPQD